MTRRPTPLPLTRTERDALDQLIRRGARALSPADGNRLLRLLQLDQADRQQERRTAGGMERANRELRQKLKDAAVQLALLSGEPCAGRPCAGSGCSHEKAGAELGALEAEIESERAAVTCGLACAEGHTYYGRCVLQTGDETGDALRRISDEMARHRAGGGGDL